MTEKVEMGEVLALSATPGNTSGRMDTPGLQPKQQMTHQSGVSVLAN